MAASSLRANSELRRSGSQAKFRRWSSWRHLLPALAVNPIGLTLHRHLRRNRRALAFAWTSPPGRQQGSPIRSLPRPRKNRRRAGRSEHFLQNHHQARRAIIVFHEANVSSVNIAGIEVRFWWLRLFIAKRFSLAVANSPLSSAPSLSMNVSVRLIASRSGQMIRTGRPSSCC